jgi:hypothetical protein
MKTIDFKRGVWNVRDSDTGEIKKKSKAAAEKQGRAIYASGYGKKKRLKTKKSRR